MNSNTRSEKINQLNSFQKLQEISGLFRIIEISVVLMLILAQALASTENSDIFFPGLLVVLKSPRFMFLVGNAIVISLLAKSGLFSGQDSSTNGWGTDIYDEFIDQSGKNRIGLEHKQKQRKTGENRVDKNTTASGETKNYQRSQPVNLNVGFEKSRHILRRSETEKCKKVVSSSEKSPGKGTYSVDGMSNDEFRSKIEAFIARQQRGIRETECTVF